MKIRSEMIFFYETFYKNIIFGRTFKKDNFCKIEIKKLENKIFLKL